MLITAPIVLTAKSVRLRSNFSVDDLVPIHRKSLMAVSFDGTHASLDRFMTDENTELGVQRPLTVDWFSVLMVGECLWRTVDDNKR